MAIKSKNFKYSLGLKIVALLLGLTGAATLFFGMSNWRKIRTYLSDVVSGEKSGFLEKSENGGYSLTAQIFIEDMRQKTNQFYLAKVYYQSEDYVKSGKTATASRIQQATQDYTESFRQEVLQTQQSYDSQIAYAQEIGDEALEQSLVDEKEESLASLETNYEKNVNGIRDQIINRDLEELQWLNQRLETLDGYCYTIFKDGVYQSGDRYTIEDYETKIPFAIVGRQGSESGGYPVSSGFYGDPQKWSQEIEYQNMPADTILMVGLRQSEYNRLQALYTQEVASGQNSLWVCIGSMLLLLFSMGWLLVTGGKRPTEDRTIHITILDKLYLDVQLVICITIEVFFLIASSALLKEWSSSSFVVMNEMGSGMSNSALYLLGSSMYWGIYLIGVWFTCSFVKRLRRGEALRHTLVYQLFSLIRKGILWTAKGLKRFFITLAHRHPVGRYGWIFAVINLLLAVLMSMFAADFTILLFVGVGATALETYIMKKRAVALELLREDIEKIREGDLEHKARSTGVEDIDQIAYSVNNLSGGLKNAVEQQVKSERMKVELITNVSHDLKTPLTSMVNYLDLLKKEELTPAHANDYVRIIDQKLSRLRVMVQDLFDIAKVQSGNMKMNLERIDLNNLIEQALAENEDRLQQNHLSFKINLPQEHIYIRADGGKLWRVLDNLIGNAVKYSLEGTRIYLDMTKGTSAIVTLKNVANYEMNFDTEEITERFNRADKARSTEGSGLGLSIAKSFLRAQGGTLAISVDGDLFKAIVTMPLWEEGIPYPQPEQPAALPPRGQEGRENPRPS